MTVNSQTSGPHSAPPACPHPQDQGAFLCVVDDSNEHMLSVWDCGRGTKLAEIKVRGRVACRHRRLGLEVGVVGPKSPDLPTYYFLSGCRLGPPPSL